MSLARYKINAAPPGLAEAITAEVRGEAVLWADAPKSWAYARGRWISALMGIPFTAFAVFWTWAASSGLSKGRAAAPTFMVLWGLMFVGFGLSMLLSPLFGIWKAGRVFYVVTSRRAIIFEKVLRLKIQTFDAVGFEGFERISRGGTGGDVIFERKIERRGRGTRTSEIGFLGLENFREAEAALQAMMSQNERRESHSSKPSAAE